MARRGYFSIYGGTIVTAADERFQQALGHVAAVQAVLRQLPGQPWVGYFDRIAASLTSGDVEASVRARDAIPYAGMGAFGDFLEAYPQKALHWNAIDRIIGALKVQARYGDPRS